MPSQIAIAKPRYPPCKLLSVTLELSASSCLPSHEPCLLIKPALAHSLSSSHQTQSQFNSEVVESIIYLLNQSSKSAIMSLHCTYSSRCSQVILRQHRMTSMYFLVMILITKTDKKNISIAQICPLMISIGIYYKLRSSL